MNAPLLSVEAVSKRFAGLQAVDAVSFNVFFGSRTSTAKL